MKSIRHGHPSTLHRWWARRPLAACRGFPIRCRGRFGGCARRPQSPGFADTIFGTSGARASYRKRDLRAEQTVAIGPIVYVPGDIVADMILDSLEMSRAQFADGTGWEVKPEGACKAEVCVPLAPNPDFDLVTTAKRLGMALVHDAKAGLWALGPESLGDRALVSAQAPELVLDDINANTFRLSSLRGQKVAIVSWAPY